MMENLMFSLEATIPVFLVIVLGYALRRIGMLNDEFIRIANKFNFEVTLPVLLFRDIYTADITSVWDPVYVLYCALVTTVSFFLIWFLAKRFLKDQFMTGAFAQGAFRSSAAVLGIAFIQNMYGSSGMAPLMIVGAVPLYNIFAVVALTLGSREAGKESGMERIRITCKNILTNPIILGIVVGLVFSLLKIPVHSIFSKTINSVASMATPLALVTIGAAFEGRKALKKVVPTLWASGYKLVFQAAIFLPLAIWLGFRDEKLIAILIMLAAPTTPSCYIMAKNMHNDDVLTSSIIVTTTLLSAFTLTAWIYLLKSAGLL